MCCFPRFNPLKGNKIIRVRMLACIFVAGLLNSLNAAPVTAVDAGRAAKAFIDQCAHKQNTAINLSKISTSFGSRSIVAVAPSISSNAETNGYMVELSPSGFILMRTDDNLSPVKLYSDKGAISNLPPDFLKCMDWELSQEILSAKQTQGISNKTRSKNKQHWMNLLSRSIMAAAGSVASNDVTAAWGAVLTTTTWDQASPYNLYAPEVNWGSSRAPAGCVAIAMAQILRYHGRPAAIDGNPEYYDPGACYGWRYASDAGLGAYDWGNMPTAVYSWSPAAQQHAVAQLIYHCGVSVSMDYESGVSGAYSVDVPNALRSYFGYNCGDLDWRSNYDWTEEWASLIQNEIMAGRPIYYGFWSPTAGHAVVCDGTDGNGWTDNYEIHLNFGWGGSADAWYILDDTGTIFTGDTPWQSHVAIFGITPPAESPVLSVTPGNQPVGSMVGTTTFTVSNTGGGTMSYSTSELVPWLSITSGGSGGNSGTITISYDANLSTSPRTGTITVTASGASDSPASVTVTQMGTTTTGCVLAWGENGTGQCNVPADALSGMSAIAAGYCYTVALKSGKVVAWGENSDGQCNVPTEAQSGVSVIAAGYAHAVALKNGRVLAWGNNDYGQCNVPSEAQSEVTAIAAFQHTVALKNGKVLAWGKNSDGQCNVPAEAQSGVSAISAGWSHTVALKNGKVLAWGGNVYGQCNVPAEALSGVTAIAAAGVHTLALKDGKVLSWELNSYTVDNVPAEALSGVTAIAAGFAHAVALKNGQVLAWGNNDYGQCNVPAGALSGVSAIAASLGHTVALFGSSVLPPALSVTPANQPVTSEEGSTTFAVSNTGGGTMSYSTSESVSWLSITSGGSGGNSGTITVSYDANPGAVREGIVTVTAPGASDSPKQVKVTQAAKTYTVSYNANGATSGTVPTPQTKTHGVTLTLAANSGNLAKSGSIFAGWNTAANGSGTGYAAGGIYNPNASVTLYAKWMAGSSISTSQRIYFTFDGSSYWAMIYDYTSGRQENCSPGFIAYNSDQTFTLGLWEVQVAYIYNVADGRYTEALAIRDVVL